MAERTVIFFGDQEGQGRGVEKILDGVHHTQHNSVYTSDLPALASELDTHDPEARTVLVVFGTPEAPTSLEETIQTGRRLREERGFSPDLFTVIQVTDLSEPLRIANARIGNLRQEGQTKQLADLIASHFNPSSPA